MIVNRRTFVVKRGCMQDLVAMVKAEQERLNVANAFRLYTPNIGPLDSVVAEWEFESLQEYDKFWADWLASPETARFMKKWYELTESGGVNEIWDLET